MSNHKAPEGTIYVCAACGKRSRWRYGFDEAGKNCGPSKGWDGSCMTHAVLCSEASVVLGPNGKATAAEAVKA